MTTKTDLQLEIRIDGVFNEALPFIQKDIIEALASSGYFISKDEVRILAVK
jgi:hypothetical protein